jgi:lysozyme
MADVWAIDVSRWQNTIDWHTVKTTGVGGAWIKVAGADGGLYKDSQCDNNLRGAAAAGVAFGTYYFVEPFWGRAVEQARHAVECGHGQGDLWPTIDIEINPHGLSGRDLDIFTNEFNTEVERLTGRKSIVYCGAYTGVGHTDSFNPDDPLWVANYPTQEPGTEPPPGYDPKVPYAWQDEGWSAWQFNSTTYVPGIYGNTVDQNTVDAAFWAQMLGEEQPEEEEEMPTRGLVRTKPGSAWAKEHIGWNDGEVYLATMEGSGMVRWLASWSAVEQEAFWLGIAPSDSLLVDDIFLNERYFYEEEGEGATAASANASAVGFSLALVALVIVLLEWAIWAEKVVLTQTQVAGIVGALVTVALLTAAFMRVKVRRLRKRLHRGNGH